MKAEPTVFGQPITFALCAICAMHLILCIVIMSTMVIGTPLHLGSIIVSPLIQWFYGSFTLVSIVAIVCAAVGALHHIESHLSAYGSVLLISIFVDIAFIAVFLFWGKSCSTSHGSRSNSNRLVSTMSCGVHDGMELLCLTLLVIFKGLAFFIANKCLAHVRSSYNQKLIQDTTPFVKKDKFAGFHDIPEMREFEPGTLPPNSPHFSQSTPVTMTSRKGSFVPQTRPSVAQSFQPISLPPIILPMATNTPSPRSHVASFQAAPQTVMAMQPSMRSLGPSMRSNSPSNYTSFGAGSPPVSMVPSMGPSMGMNAYGTANRPPTETIKVS